MYSNLHFAGVQAIGILSNLNECLFILIKWYSRYRDKHCSITKIKQIFKSGEPGKCKQ